MNKLRLFEYDNYRSFLKDYYAHSKAQNPRFSFRYFSRLASLKSPSFFKHVIDGERNLTEDTIEKFARALKFNKEEAEFFKNLVHLNQAETVDEKQFFSREILKSKAYRRLNPLKESQVKVLWRWYFIPLRELVGMPGFKEDPAWIAKTIIPNITPQQVRDAIDDLLKAGLLERDSRKRLQQSNRFVIMDDSVTSASRALCIRELLARASESMDFISRDERELGAVTMRLSTESIKKIKELIQNFRNDVLEVASRDQSPDAIYQWNFQLFPLAKIDGEKK